MRSIIAAALLLCSHAAIATPMNIALRAHATASSATDGFDASQVCDGKLRLPGKGEWRSQSKVTFWGEIDYPWVELSWDEPQRIDRVVIYGRAGADSHIASGVLRFSDGSAERVLQIPADGSPRQVTFAARQTEWIRFEATDGDGPQLGLSEIEVYPTADALTGGMRHLEAVDPYIETTRGRYFFFVTGTQPFGHISAAPLTRNKNQDGGGYNYNDTEVLGFPQLHGWMLSGLNLMPVSGEVDPRQGMDGWKSAFSHDGEVVQPAYHRLYLDRYNIWVEQTASDHASLYRLIYCQQGDAGLLVNLGGYISTTTMTGAHARRLSDNRIEGWFDTTGRLWGGPDRTRIFFVVETSLPISSVSAWEGDRLSDNAFLKAAYDYTPRNEGMSYGDSPSAGLYAHFTVGAGDTLLVRSAVSYVDLDGARRNMAEGCPHWDFDQLRHESQQQWEDWLGRIDVEGGLAADRTKLYTDLWHALLGRHKIDDVDGRYPDYYDVDSTMWKTGCGARLRTRQLPLTSEGKPLHHIYNSDALWLSQWNLNILWGLAYPEVLDDFAAAFLQSSLDGGLLARGPNLGGYSYIMSGCPASTLIGSAYQQGLTRKWDARTALREMVRNQLPGGMQGMNEGDGLAQYIDIGYCPDKAGLTMQWAFEDYVLSEMAAALGEKRVAEEFAARSHRWTESFHPDLHLVLPRRADGTWLHTDPLSGWGYEEANAWQATFGLSHDIDRLAELMGGSDSLCAKLNYAFEQASAYDFVASYNDGWVSYANQPGLSNAHVFAHAGKPWLTQKWVRAVRRQAYGGTTPDLGYGGHDEDQGQMGALSALMSIGLFSLDGLSSRQPQYDITSPLFSHITISLNPDYYNGGQVVISTSGLTQGNDYLQSLRWNGQPLSWPRLPHSLLTQGGTLEIELGAEPNMNLK